MATATFNLEDQDGTPLVGVTVRAYDEDNTDLVTEGVTDAAGSVDLTLTPGTYYARFYPLRPKSTVDSPQRFTVIDPGSNIFDVVGWQFKHPTSPYSGFCLISGHFIDAHGQPLQNQLIRLIPKWDPASLGEQPEGEGPLGYFPKTQSVTTDANGYAEFLLPRNMGCILVVIAGYEDWSVEVGTPNTSWCDLIDFLFPQADELEWDPAGPVAVAVGDSEDVEPLLTLTSQVVLDSSTDRQSVEVVSFESSDTAVATISISSGILRITGVSAGTATITATVMEGVFSERLPAPALTVTPLVVNVS